MSRREIIMSNLLLQRREHVLDGSMKGLGDDFDVQSMNHSKTESKVKASKSTSIFIFSFFHLPFLQGA